MYAPAPRSSAIGDAQQQPPSYAAAAAPSHEDEGIFSSAQSRYQNDPNGNGRRELGASEMSGDGFRSFPPSAAPTNASTRHQSQNHNYSPAQAPASSGGGRQQHYRREEEGGGNNATLPQPLHYDADGHPIKPSQNPQPQQGAPRDVRGSATSDYYPPPPPPVTSPPIYNSDGSPIKPHQQQQHRQQQYEYAQQQQQFQQQQQQRGPSPASAVGTNRNTAIQPSRRYPSTADPSAPPPREGKWQTSYCNIFADCGVCIEGCLCYCSQEARVYNAVHFDKPNDCDVGICALTACLVVFFNMQCTVDLFNRRELVQKYGIKTESFIESCLYSCCCPNISMCQMHREMQARGVHPGGACCAKYKPAVNKPAAAAASAGYPASAVGGGGGRGPASAVEGEPYRQGSSYHHQQPQQHSHHYAYGQPVEGAPVQYPPVAVAGGSHNNYTVDRGSGMPSTAASAPRLHRSQMSEEMR